jgi:hypothetical protein
VRRCGRLRLGMSSARCARQPLSPRRRSVLLNYPSPILPMAAPITQDNRIRVLHVAGSEACDQPEAGGFVTARFNRMLTPALIYVVQRYHPERWQEPLERAIEPPCRVSVFSDPREAVLKFASEPHKPDLLITGLVLETMLWHQLVLECKALHPRLKVIVYSVMVGLPGVEKLIEKAPAKPDSVIEKFDVETLLAEAQRLLRFAKEVDGAQS